MMTTHKTPSPFQSTRVLITAGPTREPIDDVRFIGNRSSGTLGIALARQAATIGLQTNLALGESVLRPNDLEANCLEFDTTAELRTLLHDQFPTVDILVMAAAVADHTPRLRHEGKLRAASDRPLTIELEPTPDLLADLSQQARGDQLLVGFALEPKQRLHQQAQAKLESKGVDLIIANPLETMDANEIDAVLVGSSHLATRIEQPPGIMTKPAFAAWLWPQLLNYHQAKVAR